METSGMATHLAVPDPPPKSPGTTPVLRASATTTSLSRGRVRVSGLRKCCDIRRSPSHLDYWDGKTRGRSFAPRLAHRTMVFLQCCAFTDNHCVFGNFKVLLDPRPVFKKENPRQHILDIFTRFPILLTRVGTFGRRQPD